MKKFTLVTALIICSFSIASATTIIVRVSDFQFKAKTVNAKVGDTIKWVWKGGIHTTTSVSIPAGAVAWNRPMDSAHKTFKYILRVAGTYQYQCTFHAPFMVGTLNVTTPLAAGLNGFAVNGDNLKAILNWKTITSKEVAYFSVERSTDGDNFREIKRVLPSIGNVYSFVDNEATGKYVYYQLKMVDTRGITEFTDIKMNTRDVTFDKLVTSLSPNPISSPGHLMLQFNSDIEGSMRVQLFAQNGRLIKEANMWASKGVNNGHFHMGDLPSGTYYILCSLGT
ncbi:MAG: plastocyanin/azurin family copper-binding protein, partial [Panacibacter sp.]